MPNRHLTSHEWPYVAGSTCLVVLLVWQPLQPPSIVVFPPAQLVASVAAEQRSLQEIDSDCYQVHTEAMDDGYSSDKASSVRSDGAREFSRSILTCQNGHGRPVPGNDMDKPQNLMIEVIKSNHSF